MFTQVFKKKQSLNSQINIHIRFAVHVYSLRSWLMVTGTSYIITSLWWIHSKTLSPHIDWENWHQWEVTGHCHRWSVLCHCMQSLPGLLARWNIKRYWIILAIVWLVYRYWMVVKISEFLQKMLYQSLSTIKHVLIDYNFTDKPAIEQWTHFGLMCISSAFHISYYTT